jgi:predicted transcriptional regulator
MSTARTPRQQQGEDLVPLTLMVTRATKDALWKLAMAEQRSLSQTGRMAIEAYVEERHQARDAAAG